jgi:hypothetical protein
MLVPKFHDREAIEKGIFIFLFLKKNPCLFSCVANHMVVEKGVIRGSGEYIYTHLSQPAIAISHSHTLATNRSSPLVGAIDRQFVFDVLAFNEKALFKSWSARSTVEETGKQHT